MQGKISVPKVAIIPVTYNCNAKCVMCNIWKRKVKEFIKIEDLSNLLDEPLLANNLQSVNLTGGEPTLREDLVDFTEVLLRKCQGLETITLNSNGLIPELIENAVKGLCQLQKHVRKYTLLCYLSMDGIGDIHDKIRGVKGSYDKLLKSIELLQEIKKEFDFSFSVNFTINSLNYKEIENVYEYAKNRDIKVDFTYSMKSSIYFDNDNLEQTEIEENEAQSYICDFISRLLSEGYFTQSSSYYRNLIQMINGRPRKVGCIFANEGFFLDPSGDVYRCWAFDTKLGNIYQNSFSDIWNGEEAQKSLIEIKEQCKKCYNNCYSQYKRIDSIKKILNNTCK